MKELIRAPKKFCGKSGESWMQNILIQVCIFGLEQVVITLVPKQKNMVWLVSFQDLPENQM